MGSFRRKASRPGGFGNGSLELITFRRSAREQAAVRRVFQVYRSQEACSTLGSDHEIPLRSVSAGARGPWQLSQQYLPAQDLQGLGPKTWGSPALATGRVPEAAGLRARQGLREPGERRGPAEARAARLQALGRLFGDQGAGPRTRTPTSEREAPSADGRADDKRACKDIADFCFNFEISNLQRYCGFSFQRDGDARPTGRSLSKCCHPPPGRQPAQRPRPGLGLVGLPQQGATFFVS